MASRLRRVLQFLRDLRVSLAFRKGVCGGAVLTAELQAFRQMCCGPTPELSSGKQRAWGTHCALGVSVLPDDPPCRAVLPHDGALQLLRCEQGLRVCPNRCTGRTGGWASRARVGARPRAVLPAPSAVVGLAPPSRNVSPRLKISNHIGRIGSLRPLNPCMPSSRMPSPFIIVLGIHGLFSVCCGMHHNVVIFGDKTFGNVICTFNFCRFFCFFAIYSLSLPDACESIRSSTHVVLCVVLD